MSGTENRLITPDLLRALGCDQETAIKWAGALDEAAQRYGMYKPTVVEDWLGQLVVESERFTKTSENLYYVTPQRLLAVWPTRFAMQRGTGKRFAPDYVRNPQKLANAVYSGRMGNGDETSGDGWRFAGGGIGQLTGREMWEGYARYSGRDVVSNPALFEQVAVSADSAAWVFAVAKGLILLAEQDLVRRIAKRYNGGLVGFEDRQKATAAVRRYFVSKGVALDAVFMRQVDAVNQVQQVQQVQQAVNIPVVGGDASRAVDGEMVQALRRLLAGESQAAQVQLTAGKPWWQSRLLLMGVGLTATAVAGAAARWGWGVDAALVADVLLIALAIGGPVIVWLRGVTKTVIQWGSGNGDA